MAQDDESQYRGIISTQTQFILPWENGRWVVVTCSSTSVFVVYYDNGKNNVVLQRLCSCFQLGPRAAVTQHRSLLR